MNWANFLSRSSPLAIYAVQPFPGELLAFGSANGLIEMTLVGVIVGAIYKPSLPPFTAGLTNCS